MTSSVITARLSTRVGDLLAQPRGERVVERGERFVENEEIGIDGKGAGERDAAGEAERQLAGEMAAMGAQFQNGRTGLQAWLHRIERRGKPHIVLDRAPGQQPRLLEHHAEAAPAGRDTRP